MIDIAPWKPVLSALALPPTTALLLALIGARMAAGRRRGLGFLLVLLAVVVLWLGACTGTARWLERHVLKVPAALSSEDLVRLARAAPDRRRPDTVIVVLGGGRRSEAPEFGRPDLSERSLSRLRYGAWLARRTGLPLAFTGGVGWAQTHGESEAAIAAHIARDELGTPLRWREEQSRDTRENAAYTVALLAPAGVHEIVLVTHANHMPRSVSAFQQAASRAGAALRIVPAPMGFADIEDRPVLAWLPSAQGYRGVFDAAHEWAGQITGH